MLINYARQVFPKGLPEEFSFVATFRLKRTTKKERWCIWQITDQSGNVKVSIIVDGSRKTVEYSAKGRSGNTLHLTFKKRELGSLFDRQWHKLAIIVKSGLVSLYKDCKLVDTKRSEEIESIDVHGKTVIGVRVSDGTPVDFDLQRIMIYCNPQLTELETCCEIPGALCSTEDGFHLAVVASKDHTRQTSLQSNPKSDSQKHSKNFTGNSLRAEQSKQLLQTNGYNYRCHALSLAKQWNNRGSLCIRANHRHLTLTLMSAFADNV
ncbi:collagen alpha-1(XIX) chain [Heptranchias perlo]|uniref:collagen alpha-1(XIX) chain n=1 Tax=Heptranchias perlo TaxID=212740 RepID=UPI003559CCE8